MNKECPAPVLELISYLGKSGTGKAKLEALMKLGCTCNGAEEFLAKAAKVVPEGTMAKINTYIESQKIHGDNSLAVGSTEPSKAGPSISSPEVPKVSSVSDMNASDSIEFIKMLDDKSALEVILELDTRKTVKEAATNRLNELNKSREAA